MSQWKLSAGTACLLGRRSLKIDVLPTTAYILLGEKCQNNCRFCAQARDSTAGATRLSRITWTPCPEQETAAAVAAAFRAGQLRRACLQIVKEQDSWQASIAALAALTRDSRLPVCISTDIETIGQAGELLARGADRLSLALDAATPTLYHEVKGQAWNRRWELLQYCAREFPGRITTHLMVGLGETEEQMINRLAACRENTIQVGLFAFTPLRGTAWGNKQPPAIGQYRRVQIAHFLLSQGWQREVFQYQGGTLVGINRPKAAVLAALAAGTAFETSGCPGCNRPYYNERPGKTMYNYPRELTTDEVQQAIAESGLFSRRASLPAATVGEGGMR